MSKKQKNNTIIIGFIVILLALATTFYVLSNRETEPIEKDKPILNVVNYNVFDYENVDFRFVVVEIGVVSEEDLNIELSEIKVNNLRLNTKDDYIAKLLAQDYKDNFSKIDEMFFVNEQSSIVTLFLPIIDKNDVEAKLTSQYFDDLVIDLSKNVIVVKNEKPPVDDDGADNVVVKDGYTLKTLGFFNNRDFKYFYDGVEFNSSSNEVLHVIPVKLISNDKKVYKITEAKFVFDEFDSELIAEDSSFKTVDHESIIGIETSSEKEGSLIFVSFSQSLEPVTYKGVLMIKVNNGEWIELEVVI